MANKPLKSVKFPGLPDTYTVPQFDSATGGMGTQGTIPDSKAVKDAISTINNQLSDIQGDIKPLSSYPDIRGNINSSGYWAGVTSGSYYHKLVPITPGDALTVICSSTVSNIIAFMRSNTAPVQGAAADLSEATGFTTRIQLTKSSTNNYVVPSDAHYLYLYVATAMPTVIINGLNIDIPYNQIVKSAYTGTQQNSADIDGLEDSIESINDSLDFKSVEAYPANDGFINAEGYWSNINSNYTHIVMPVKSGDRVLIVGNDTYASYFAFVKSYTTAVSGAAVDFSAATGFTERIQSNKGAWNWYDVPSDVNYIIVQIKSGGNVITPKDVRINNVNFSTGIVGNFEELYRPITVNWCAMGDSITASYHSEFVDGESVTSTDDREDIVWTYLVSRINKWRMTNKAIGGTGYLDEGAGRCGWKVARETDFTPFNLVTIAYGCNDWKGNCVMGTINDDGSAETPTTVMQAMKATIEAIMASNPNCKIIVITPLNCYGYSKDYGTKATNYGLGYEFANSGTLESFFSKIVEVCNYYGIQYIDMTHYSPINRENLPTMLPDGVHPSIACHNMIAHQLSKQITF